MKKLSVISEGEVHRRNPTVVRNRCAQRCDSENEHSAVAVKTSNAL